MKSLERGGGGGGDLGCRRNTVMGRKRGGEWEMRVKKGGREKDRREMGKEGNE